MHYLSKLNKQITIMKKLYAILLFFGMVLMTACSTTTGNRSQLDISGNWQFKLDTANVGVSQKWYTTDFDDTVTLPGTTDSNEKGFKNTDTTTMHLNRPYTYEGAAWYRKKITIPADFKDKHVILYLERTKPSKLFIDDKEVGESRLLQSAQQFDVTEYLSPGEHYITLCVNNNLKLTPYGNVHIYSDDTQTNWNGIIGKMYVEASAKTYITDLQVYPDIENNQFSTEINIAGITPETKISVEMQLTKIEGSTTTPLETRNYKVGYKPQLKLTYNFPEDCGLWDEFHQPLYELLVTITTPDKAKDTQLATFGMRDFATSNKHFTINGKTTFLRGKHEAAVFPLTGHTPMDVASWKKVFEIAKSYGINHYRFHTYTPPEAAFTAADEVGIYLQTELPFWGGLDVDSVATMLIAEGRGMLKSYANHPSFVMFSPGNEIWSGHDRVEKVMTTLKKEDSRPLYTMGSNNNIGYLEPRDYAEFFVGSRTPGDATTTYHTRLTHAFADAEDGGILNTQTPGTTVTFDTAVDPMNIPVVSHEIGQYQIYPDYAEINKYTGPVKAWNLMKFKDSLTKAGMGNMDKKFQKASGAWAALCYKAEMEAALRTKGMAGFQLLDLQDFPGQGTALVGILDAFMDSKGVITKEAWKQSCNDVVLLLEFPSYCFTNSEAFVGNLVVPNFSADDITTNITYKLTTKDGKVIQQHEFSKETLVQGKLNEVGKISFGLSQITKATELLVTVAIPNTEYNNTYPIWVYPSKIEPKTDSIIVADKIGKEIFNQLEAGAKVVLFPNTKSVQENSIPGHFPPDFWNYNMFKSICENNGKPVSPGTLGILTNPEHPIFTDFPTDSYTNWQWFSILKGGSAMILNNTEATYRPIVQVIDNLERNYKLGLIFEFKVGKGKLLVCMSDLRALADKPEATQLYESILNYMRSDAFDPKDEINDGELTEFMK